MGLDYIKGMTWGWVGTRGTWATPEAKDSMAKMTDLGVNWTALAFSGHQKGPHETEIIFQGDDAQTVTDEEIYWAIAEAKSHGLKVALKPVVNCLDGTWRAHIGFFDQEVPREPSWSEWFANYEEFILHYAEIAEETGSEMLCIGCEMVQANKRGNEWRTLIGKVRAVYGGIVTYNCDKYQEDRIDWWDAVDVISASGYYPEGTWPEHISRIKKVVDRFNKPFFFMETGCPSRTGSAKRPNDWTHQGERSEEEQQRFYEEMFSAFHDMEWFSGYMLWDWPPRLYDLADVKKDDGYSVYGKKAEQTIKTYFAKK